MPISKHLKNLRSMIGTTLLQVPAVAAVIRDEGGRILLQRRASDGTWSLPAGAIDPGEAPAQAMAREVWEETGLLVVPERLIGLFSGEGFRHTYINGDRVEYMVALFLCSVVGGTLGGRDDETIELRYFHPEEMPRLAVAYPGEIFTGEGLTPLFEWNDAWLEEFR